MRSSGARKALPCTALNHNFRQKSNSRRPQEDAERTFGVNALQSDEKLMLPPPCCLREKLS